MVNIGKIHRNLFIGIFGLLVPIPNLTSITKDYLIPLIQKDIQIIPFGKIVLLILSLTIFIISFIWIKEVIEDLEKTSRFMNKGQYKEFIAKTIFVILFSFLVGIIVNRYLFTS